MSNKECLPFGVLRGRLVKTFLEYLDRRITKERERYSSSFENRIEHAMAYASLTTLESVKSDFLEIVDEILRCGIESKEKIATMSIEEKVALKLMDAIKLAYREDANILNFIITEVHQAIENLNLPKRRCENCGKKMSWFDYHLCNGICPECADKILYEEEDA